MHWHPNPGATLNSQILIEACGCAKDGRWKTFIFFYRPMTRDGGAAGAAGQQQHPDLPRDLLGVALHERPGLYFSTVRAQRLVFQADAAFPQVMEKLQSYKARVALNFEVEYYPLSSIEKSRAIMEDFFDIWQETIAKKSLPGHFINVESNFSDYAALCASHLCPSSSPPRSPPTA
ncbi:hypothetical protein PR202_gb04225 [Eleusine coracana subsp. coracana]|uniref:Mediator of RNA polymerase II transcription subunit 20 n=1 Tax=Eleusine coracana subsp. coracana TaxID=191504 RepID=A0AAV5E414_ELECO|nr:hypothetical protein PR202_gb04225 [Eleusine coracana subsp. coracana]